MNQHFKFCIDHNRNNSIDADFKYAEEDCGACSEIIFKLLCEMNVTIKRQIANLLYTVLAGPGADTYDISKRNVFVKPKGHRMIEDILKDIMYSYAAVK